MVLSLFRLCLQKANTCDRLGNLTKVENHRTAFFTLQNAPAASFGALAKLITELWMLLNSNGSRNTRRYHMLAVDFIWFYIISYDFISLITCYFVLGGLRPPDPPQTPPISRVPASLTSWTYSNVASKLFKDPLIYWHLASKLLIDPWIY